MKVYEVVPRGYCLGVIKAIELAKDVVKKNPGKKISILGMLVHNSHVNKEMEELGITIVDDKTKTRLQLLDDIDGDIVITTAHGVGDVVINNAKFKNLTVFDATCKYVKQTHEIIKKKLDEGYIVLYLGQKGHPESEGAISISKTIVLIEEESQLPNDGKKYFITNQTTLSYEMVEKVYLKAKQLGIEVANEICDATRTRQQALKNIPHDVDVIVVVGDKRSNNTKKLFEIAFAKTNNAYLVETVDDLDKK